MVDRAEKGLLWRGDWCLLVIEGGGGGRFGEIHTEEHNWDEMDGSVKVEKRFLWSWVERVVRGG